MAMIIDRDDPDHTLSVIHHPRGHAQMKAATRSVSFLCRAPTYLLLTALLFTSGVVEGAERSRSVRNAFVAANPCPIYDDKAKKCLAEVDHMEPICANGPDTVENLQWLSKEQHALKTKIDILRCARLRALRDVENGK